MEIIEPQEVAIAGISLIPGWQETRPLNEETMVEYLEAIDRGEQLPPVEIIDDVSNLWLWDGYHRLECRHRRKKISITAHVRAGTFSDAVRLAAGSNREHGLRRTAQTKHAIIEWLLTNPESPYKSETQKTIANMVHVSQPYVSKVFQEILGGHVEDENRVSGPKTNLLPGYKLPSGPGRPRTTVQQVEAKRRHKPHFQPRNEFITSYKSPKQGIADQPPTQQAVLEPFRLALTGFTQQVRDEMSEHPESWEGIDRKRLLACLSELATILSGEQPKSKRFVKPTPEEVDAYAKSIGANVNGEAFCAYYEAGGWMRGKTPIKDWRAAVKTWKSRDAQAKPRISGKCRKCKGPADFEAPDNAGKQVPWCKKCQPRLYEKYGKSTTAH